MPIDTGLAVIIVAVLIFYLRMIILQRERVKRVRRANEAAAAKGKKKGKQSPAGSAQPVDPSSYSMISKKRTDRIIGAAGFALILLGVLCYLKVFPSTILQEYWWLPTALGIVGFSWLFKL